MIERTLVIFKPNLVENLEVETATRLMEKLEYLSIQSFPLRQLSVDFFKEFYQHVPEPDCTRHATFCASGRVKILIFEGEEIIQRVRQAIGDTDSSQASFRTLRGFFYDRYHPENPYDNFIHASSSQADFEREMKLLATVMPEIAHLVPEPF